MMDYDDDGWKQTTCMHCNAPLGRHYFEMLENGNAWCLCRTHRPRLLSLVRVSDACGEREQGFVTGCGDYVAEGTFVRVYEVQPHPLQPDRDTMPEWVRV